jgi:hypothetical protein
MKNCLLGAYWGPACQIENGRLSETSQRNLLQYQQAGFSLYTVTSLNAYASSFGKRGSLLNTDLLPILDFCARIGLKVIVRDEAIQRLSNVRLALVENGKTKPILCQSDSGEWLFPDEKATLKDGVLLYCENGMPCRKSIRQNINQFSSQSRLNECLLSFMSAYATHPAYAGLDLWDEPALDRFSAIAQLSKAIAFADAKLGTHSLLQQCLLPSYGFPNLEAFEHYLSSYAKMASETKTITTIRSDVYPLNHGRLCWDQNVYEGDYLMKDYPLCLKILSKTASDFGLDFELCLQSFGNRSNLRGVTPIALGFQAGVALAFGAKNISYYTYSHDTHGPAYTSAIVEGRYEEGYREGGIYPAVKELNRRLPEAFDFQDGYRLNESSLYGVNSGTEYETCRSYHYYYHPFSSKPMLPRVLSARRSVLLNELSKGTICLYAISNLADVDHDVVANPVLLSLPASFLPKVFGLFGHPRAFTKKNGLLLLALSPGETCFLKDEK